jgi:hypothetical protein
MFKEPKKFTGQEQVEGVVQHGLVARAKDS